MLDNTHNIRLGHIEKHGQGGGRRQEQVGARVKDVV